MLRNHLKLVLRKLRKERIYTFVNITGLTIGLTAFLLIALYVRDELSFDQFHTNKDNIYRVTSLSKGRNGNSISGYIASDFAEFFTPQVPQIESFTRLSTVNGTILVEEGEKQLYANKVFYADKNFFEFFDFKLINSNKSGVFSSGGQAVVTEQFAKKFFNDEDPVGRSLKINKTKSVMINGVVSEPPSQSHIQFEMLIYEPGHFENTFKKYGGIRNVITYVEVKEGAEFIALKDQLNDARSIPPYSNFFEAFDYQFDLLPMTEQRLSAPYSRDFFELNDMRFVKLFTGIALIVLFLALINYMNLVTAQSARKIKEVGIRKVIGATKMNLMYHQFIESVVLVVISFLLSFGVTERLLPLLNQELDKDIQLSYSSPEFFLWVFASGIVLGLIAGIYPAMNIARFKPLVLVQKRGSFLSSKGYFRRALFLFQYVASGILLIALFLIANQMNYLKNHDLGFDQEMLVVLPLYGDAPNSMETIKTEIGKVGGVLSASLSNWKVGSNATMNIYDGKHKNGEGVNGYSTNFINADGDFLSTIKGELIATVPGFKLSDLSGNQILVNEVLVDTLNWEEPLGRKLYDWSNREKTIVGVFKNIHTYSLKEKVEPSIIEGGTSVFAKDKLLLKLDGTEFSSTVDKISSSYEKLTERPFEFYFMEDEVKAFYKKEQGQFKLFQIFSFLAVFISLLGLIALTIYMVEQRRKEVSIRKVLGASIKQLILMLNREYTVLVIIAFLIASPIAYYSMQDWLSAFKYRISIHPLLFIGALMAFMVLSWLVTILQSFRVSRENPADVLRDE